MKDRENPRDNGITAPGQGRKQPVLERNDQKSAGQIPSFLARTDPPRGKTEERASDPGDHEQIFPHVANKDTFLPQN